MLNGSTQLWSKILLTVFRQSFTSTLSKTSRIATHTLWPLKSTATERAWHPLSAFSSMWQAVFLGQTQENKMTRQAQKSLQTSLKNNHRPQTSARSSFLRMKSSWCWSLKVRQLFSSLQQGNSKSKPKLTCQRLKTTLKLTVRHSEILSKSLKTRRKSSLTS